MGGVSPPILTIVGNTGTGKREQGIGNRERGTGNREQS